MLFDPDGFFEREIEMNKPIWNGLTVVLITAFLSAITASITSPALSKAIYKYLISKGMSAEIAKSIAASIKLSVVLSPITIIVSWILISAILYGLSAIFSGSGSFTDTLKVAAYSFIPSIVVFPFNLYIAIQEARILEIQGLTGIENFKIAATIINLAVLAWQFLLWKYGIKHARNLSNRDATIVSAILTAFLLALNLYGLIHRGTFK